MTKTILQLRRVYEINRRSDGFRVLVDRLWPRGVSKENAAVDVWLRDIAPSNELRKWFNHDQRKWIEFKKRYKRELITQKDTVRLLRDILHKEKIVTLLFAASDTHYNNALALQKILSL